MTEKKAYIGARIFDGTDEHFGAALVIEKNKILKIYLRKMLAQIVK